MEELRKALKENRFGILCVTPENKDNRWIHFEAGSLWKGEEFTRVCPQSSYAMISSKLSG
jgi:hypothetical protein